MKDKERYGNEEVRKEKRNDERGIIIFFKG